MSVKINQANADLRAATTGGSVDMGIILPTDLDSGLTTCTVKLKAYICGESLAKNRAVILVALNDATPVFPVQAPAP